VPAKAAGSVIGELIRTGVPELTVCAIVADVLGASLASPPYEAESEWLPTANAEVLKVAVPPPSVAVPMVVEPSRKVIVPVAVEGVTAAVKVTA